MRTLLELESLLSSRVDKSDGLRDLLLQLSSSARDHLRTGLIRDDRDEIAQELLRYGDANGVGWADVIDMFGRAASFSGSRVHPSPG